MNRLPFVSAAVASSFLLLACDAQVDPEYRGEPLATIQGAIVDEGGSTEGHLRTAILNYNFLVDDFGHTDLAPVVGSFPAEFRIDLNVPPPAEVLNDFTRGGARPSESRFSTGYIAVLKEGLDPNVDPASIAGLAEEYMLVYVETDVQPGTQSERFLGGALSAGYHLMKWAPMTEAELQAYDACKATPDPRSCGVAEGGDADDRLVPNPEEFDSEVTIRIAPPRQFAAANLW
ncbi:hypothetical protein BE18_41650 [Sorangium cellulosum]|uniref:Secreted protein n=1 Tax=Sorangium cellulosum TaxID=56 RepID=A0A150RUV6_SORCE|nr:hypothetical protein BE18_41650 [Sorangium cellulosum]